MILPSGSLILNGFSAALKFSTGAPSIMKCADAPESDNPNSTSTILVNLSVSNAASALAILCSPSFVATALHAWALDLYLLLSLAALLSALFFIRLFHLRVTLDALLPPHGSTMCGTLVGGLSLSASDSLSSVSGSVAAVSSSSHPLTSALWAGFAAHPLSVVVLDITHVASSASSSSSRVLTLSELLLRRSISLPHLLALLLFIGSGVGTEVASIWLIVVTFSVVHAAPNRQVEGKMFLCIPFLQMLYPAASYCK